MRVRYLCDVIFAKYCGIYGTTRSLSSLAFSVFLRNWQFGKYRQTYTENISIHKTILLEKSWLYQILLFKADYFHVVIRSFEISWCKVIFWNWIRKFFLPTLLDLRVEERIQREEIFEFFTPFLSKLVKPIKIIKHDPTWNFSRQIHASCVIFFFRK